jgi:predicted peptidase
MNRRPLRVLIVTMLVAAVSLGGAASAYEATAKAPARPTTGITEVSAYSKVFDAYHQLAAVVIEHSENVVAPDTDGYSVADFITPRLREDFQRWPVSSEAPVAAVYTNNRPAMRADKTSRNGRYVVIELKPTTHSLPANEAGVNMLNHSAAMATIRTTNPIEVGDYWRTDWSDLVITQHVDVRNPRGQVVAGAGEVPSLTSDKVTALEIDRFKPAVFVNSQGIGVHYSIYVPQSYNRGHKFPLFYYVTGNGGRLNYNQRDAQGNFTNLGGALTRDPMSIALTEAGEDAIVVVPQLWRNAPAAWNNDPAQDAAELLEHIRNTYSVDKQRSYALGSSFGTFALSEVLAERPDLISAYVQFNGLWTGAPSAFSPADSRVLTGKDIAYLDALPRVAKTDAWLDQARSVMAGVVDRRIPVRISSGVNDQTIPSPVSISTDEGLKALYREAGLPDAEIDELVTNDLYEDPEYLAMGVSERHANVPVALKYNRELLPWLLSIGK